MATVAGSGYPSFQDGTGTGAVSAHPNNNDCPITVGVCRLSITTKQVSKVTHVFSFRGMAVVAGVAGVVEEAEVAALGWGLGWVLGLAAAEVLSPRLKVLFALPPPSSSYPAVHLPVHRP